MSSDVPQPVIQETDEVTERILGEWDWLKDADSKDRIELQNMQDDLLLLREKLAGDKDNLELRENVTVLDKKMRKKTQQVLETLKKK